jgi:hypothetical protein
MVWFLKIFLPKNSAKKLAFLTQNQAKLCKILIITLVFVKKRQIFRRKLSKIVENCDHNIDPWWGLCSTLGTHSKRTPTFAYSSLTLVPFEKTMSFFFVGIDCHVPTSCQFDFKFSTKIRSLPTNLGTDRRELFKPINCGLKRVWIIVDDCK